MMEGEPLHRDVMRSILQLVQYEPALGFKVVKEPTAQLVAFISQDFYDWLLANGPLVFHKHYPPTPVEISLSAGEETHLGNTLVYQWPQSLSQCSLVLGKDLVEQQVDLLEVLNKDIDDLLHSTNYVHSNIPPRYDTRDLSSLYAIAIMEGLQEGARAYRVSQGQWDFVCALRK